MAATLSAPAAALAGLDPRPALASAAIAVSLALAPSAPAEKADASPSKKADAAPQESPDSEMTTLKDIPLGQKFQGLRVPEFSPTGKLLMQLDTKTATKLDDTHLQFEELKIEIHNEDNTTFHVEMPRSVFDLDTRVLTSDSRTKIRRDDFEIVGDAAEFNTKTRFGRMKGNIKMIIYNTEKIQ